MSTQLLPSDEQARRRPLDERYRAGKARRAVVSRETLAEFEAPERDPVAVFDETNKGRLPNLVPLRYQRMSDSAFAFLRGAAALMALDLAAQPRPGLNVQACGDCHLMNFGAFLSPEGNALFDINDFDETLPDVDFTVDVKRLVASLAVAAGDNDRLARRVARDAARAYRERMAQLAAMSPLEAWQSRVDLGGDAAALFEGPIAKKLRRAAVQKHVAHEEDANFPHLVRGPDGGWRIADNPPLIYHDWDAEDPHIHEDLSQIFTNVMATFSPEVATMLSRYRLTDSAIKVVGVGSVGTYCAIGLFATEDGDPLFLQVKEASASVLERLHGKPWWGQQGARVVTGQRIMQAAADLFLGYTEDKETGRQFYVRHLKNRRLGSIAELLETSALPQYAKLCGFTLARAHARSGDAAALWGYMGKSEVFDEAMAAFAMRYAAQNAKDFERFVAVKDVKPQDPDAPARRAKR
jgi:uncharacterized protein (DUF2252 family)